MGRVTAVVMALCVLVGGWLLVRGNVPCAVLAIQPTCEVLVGPGPSEDTLPLVTVDGAPSYPPEGQLRLTTIAVQDELDLRTWLQAKTSRALDAVPRDSIFPPGSDRDEVAEQNAILMADSQLVATIAALTELGYDLEGDGALVAGFADGALDSGLEAGDVITAVDGAGTSDSRDVVDAVQARAPGDRVTLDVEGAGGSRRVSLTLGAAPDDPDLPYVGVLLTTDLELPVDVTIDAGVIGGPSAGLLFALSIVELLAPEDLTDGRIIAGTGTMDRDGQVGSVGGIRQKIVSATSGTGAQEPAEAFLVPRGNFAEARRAVAGSDVLLVPVATLTEALTALDDLRQGEQPRDAVLLAASA